MRNCYLVKLLRSSSGSRIAEQLRFFKFALEPGKKDLPAVRAVAFKHRE